LLAMWDVKRVFDPHYMLNPGKIFPPSDQDQSIPYRGYVPLDQLVPLAAKITTEGYTPTSAQETARQLQALAQAQKSITITGAALEGQALLSSTQLSMSALSGITLYAPEDLYITVGAGTPLAEIQHFLHERGQYLPLVTPWSGTTIGGLVAANINAPLRMRYGSVRDIVLCATVALTDGRVIRTGRPLVKNVAGFDLTKVFVGSYGTLGVLVDVSLKVFAQPRLRRTLLFPVADLSTGLRWGQEMVRLALTASAVVLANGAQGPDELASSPYVLAYTAEGIREDVEAELDQVREALQRCEAPTPLTTDTEALTGTELWASSISASDTADAFILRVGMPVKELARYLEDHAALLQDASFVVDFASGLIYMTRRFSTVAAANTWIETLRQAVLPLDGYAILVAQPDESLGHIKRWGYQPASLELMRRLKAQWDPQNILNPHAFVIDAD
jgi:FAD/FMN-containing dehydrogenase